MEASLSSVTLCGLDIERLRRRLSALPPRPADPLHAGYTPAAEQTSKIHLVCCMGKTTVQC